MSQYLIFYIRHGETYLPLASFCGSSTYMEAFDYEVPSYSGLAAVDAELLGVIEEKVSREIKERKKSIQDYKEMNTLILSANNSMEEKMEEVRSNNEMIEECNDELEAWTSVDYFITFLRDILDEARYASHYEKDGKPCGYEPDAVEVRDADPDKYLYVGIEPKKRKDITEMTDEELKEVRSW